jgi:DNA-binding transcriptional MerR regulator
VSELRDKNLLLTAAECAAQLGLTVRSLRIYEQHGLIAPRRTEKGWRLYGALEIGRLHEILALKRLGLSLSRMAELLAGRAVDLDRTLAVQQSALLELRKRADQSLSLVNAARAKLSVGGSLSIGELINLAKETNMTEPSLDAIAQRRYEQARPRRAIQIDPAIYDRYVGHYQFESGDVMTITREEDHIFEQLTSQNALEIFPEREREFFLKAVAAQITFVVEGGDAASALVLHQNGLDQTARRVGESEAKRLSDELANRIENSRPFPNSEAVLRRVIDETRRGEINYEQMTEPLAALARVQAPFIKADLAKKGTLQEVCFKGVGQGGWDVYDVKFANGNIECRIALTPDQKIAGLLFRPLPWGQNALNKIRNIFL